MAIKLKVEVRYRIHEKTEKSSVHENKEKGGVKFEMLPGPKIVSYELYRKLLRFVENVNVHSSLERNTLKAPKIMKITGII